MANILNATEDYNPKNGLKNIFTKLIEIIKALNTNTNAIAAMGNPKVYKALLTQTGTSAPVATVLVNTLGEVPTWAYDSLGYYKLSITGGFDVTKTFVNVGTSYNQSGGFGNPLFRTYVFTDSKIWIDSFTETLGAHLTTNGVLYATPFEIEVYP